MEGHNNCFDGEVTKKETSNYHLLIPSTPVGQTGCVVAFRLL